MEEINYLSMDIDHLVEMVTEFEKHHASDLIDIGGLTVPADILDPSNIGKDLAKILGGGGTGGSGGAGLPSLPSSTDIPGFPQGLPTTHAINPVNPHGEGGRPPVVRAPPGAGSRMWGGRSRAGGRPMAHGVFRTPRDPFY